ncbi:MAG: TRAP transporter fused permease subunit [Dehalococcoidia bacterium]
MEEPGQNSAVDAVITGKKLAVPRPLVVAVAALAIFVSIFHLYTAWFSAIPPVAQEWATLHMIMILAFLTFPLGRKSWRDKLNGWSIVDFLGIALLILFTIRFYLTYENYILIRYGNADSFDIFAGTVTIIILLELTRRCLGLPLTLVAIFLIFQGLVSDKFPDWVPFYGPPISWRTTVEFLYLQEWGLWNIPTKIVSYFIILFFILVGIWKYTGVLGIVKDLATAIAGKFTGGPAKVAVIASAFFGTIQGSSVSNVVSSGSWTIPTMKATGYKPHFAGAVEAVASSGGLITPPVMGLAAFLMADFLGISYLEVMAAAIVPTLLFYGGTFGAVHFQAKRDGLVGLPPSQIPRLLPVLAKSWLFLMPLTTLIWFLFQGFSIARAVMWSIFLLILLVLVVAGGIRWLCRRTEKARPLLVFIPPEAPPSPRGLLLALEEGGQMAVQIGVAVGTVGLIIGTFWASGLGVRISELIKSWSGDSLFVALIIAAVVALIIGMGIPFTAAYITLYMFAIPALIDLGAPPIAAHFFALFFALVSGITPPVAVTAYAAAGIAGSNMMRTAWSAMKIGIPLYFIPFFFVYNVALLGQAPILEVVRVAFTGLIGVAAISAGGAGWLLRQPNAIERLLLLGGGLALLYPSMITELIGAAALAAVYLSHWRLPYFEPLQPVFNLAGRLTGTKKAAGSDG